jgi:ATP-dependent DNA ligase
MNRMCSALPERAVGRRRKGRPNKIVLVAFDLLYLNGFDLRAIPLFEQGLAPKVDRRD